MGEKKAEVVANGNTYKPSYGEMEKWEQEGPRRVWVIKRLYFKNSVLKSGWFPKNSTQVVLYVRVNLTFMSSCTHMKKNKSLRRGSGGRWIAGPH